MIRQISAQPQPGSILFVSLLGLPSTYPSLQHLEVDLVQTSRLAAPVLESGPRCRRPFAALPPSKNRADSVRR